MDWHGVVIREPVNRMAAIGISNNDATIEYHKPIVRDKNICGCGKALKMPNSIHCASCHRDANVLKMYERRNKQGRIKKRIMAQRNKPLSNKIKGLSNIII